MLLSAFNLLLFCLLNIPFQSFRFINNYYGGVFKKLFRVNEIIQFYWPTITFAGRRFCFVVDSEIKRTLFTLHYNNNTNAKKYKQFIINTLQSKTVKKLSDIGKIHLIGLSEIGDINKQLTLSEFKTLTVLIENAEWNVPSIQLSGFSYLALGITRNALRNIRLTHYLRYIQR